MSQEPDSWVSGLPWGALALPFQAIREVPTASSHL